MLHGFAKIQNGLKKKSFFFCSEVTVPMLLHKLYSPETLANMFRIILIFLR